MLCCAGLEFDKLNEEELNLAPKYPRNEDPTPLFPQASWSSTRILSKKIEKEKN